MKSNLIWPFLISSLRHPGIIGYLRLTVPNHRLFWLFSLHKAPCAEPFLVHEFWNSFPKEFPGDIIKKTLRRVNVSMRQGFNLCSLPARAFNGSGLDEKQIRFDEFTNYLLIFHDGHTRSVVVPPNNINVFTLCLHKVKLYVVNNLLSAGRAGKREENKVESAKKIDTSDVVELFYCTSRE